MLVAIASTFASPCFARLLILDRPPKKKGRCCLKKKERRPNNKLKPCKDLKLDRNGKREQCDTAGIYGGKVSGIGEVRQVADRVIN